jgi:hypothetical protein
MSGIVIVGGAGGTRARTEDLARASAVLDGARERMEGVAAWARAARSDVRSAQWSDAIVADHVESALDWINLGPGGASAVAREIDDIARGLAETVRLLEGAERGAGGVWDGLWAAAQRVIRGEIAVGETIALVGTAVAFPSSLLIPGGPSALTGIPAPEPTSLIDASALEAALAAGHSLPVVPALMGWSAVDLLTLCLMLSAMGWSELLGNPHGLSVEESERHITSAPAGAADLIERAGELYSTGGADPGTAHVAIECIEHRDGTCAWIVEIPGTQSFLPNGGSNPFDFTADLQLMAGQTSDVMIAVAAAMRDAGIPAGDPVMLVGHSLGGIGAMALASNGSFASRYNVQAVVTAGSPVARFAPAGGASVLSLENSTDIVWALDGAPNPDRADWITVTHDLRSSGDPLDRAAATSIVGSHEPETYVRTAGAFDSATGSTAAAWREQNAAFLADGTAVSIRTTYDITRGVDGATIPSVADGR